MAGRCCPCVPIAVKRIYLILKTRHYILEVVTLFPIVDHSITLILPGIIAFLIGFNYSNNRYSFPIPERPVTYFHIYVIDILIIIKRHLT